MALMETRELGEAKELLFSALSIDPDHKISLQHLGEYITTHQPYLVLFAIHNISSLAQSFSFY